ncbi:MAG: hypothetical protein WDO16_02355 [Bacteroidota bacterium]
MFFLLNAFCVCKAQLKTATVFADHMVLQRRMKVPVWGSAKPGDKVTISYNNVSAAATADEKGYWIGYLDPMEAQSQEKT